MKIPPNDQSGQFGTLFGKCVVIGIDGKRKRMKVQRKNKIETRKFIK
jgi:hypothetical protein